MFGKIVFTGYASPIVLRYRVKDEVEVVGNEYPVAAIWKFDPMQNGPAVCPECCALNHDFVISFDKACNFGSICCGF